MNLPISLPAAWPTRFSPRLRLLISATAALVVGAGLWLGWQAYQAAQLPGTPAAAAAIEAQWGIRVTHIAVLADGGLIDFRFQVIDPDKAGPLFSLDKRPAMIVESTGQRVDSLYHPNMAHDVQAGESVYFIYNDTQGALKPGTAVSVLLGDLRLEHIVVQ